MKKVDLNKLRQVNPHWKPNKKSLEEKESKEAELMLEKQELQNVYGKWADPRFVNIEGNQVDSNWPDLIEATKEQIIKELKDQYYDIIFQAVCDKMDQNYLFKEDNYLTQAGLEEFEDVWFEWYHNHHGDILMAVLKDMGQ